VDARDGTGATPLIRAAWNGHAEAVKALLAAGADPSARMQDGATARTHAEAAGYGTVAALLVR
jgi:ankyrin repeat protein